MGRARVPERSALLALGAIVLVSRLPFLDAGYGRDGDAWALAGASRAIALTGEYVASRPPGYPLQEFVGALLWRGGPLALNGLSAVACALGAVWIACIVGRARPAGALPAGLAFAFTPTVYVASTSTMDYCASIAFALAAFLLAAGARPRGAGLALGCAIGARLGAGLFVLPCAWLLLRGSSGRRGALTATFTAGFVGAAWYAPVVLELGLANMGPARNVYPPLGEVLASGTTWLFGELGTLAVGGALLLALLSLLRPRSAPPRSSGSTQLEQAALMACSLTLGLWLWMPYSPGYLIPLVAFGASWLGMRLDPRATWVLASALALSSFVGWRAGPRPGPLLDDHRARRAELERLPRIEAAARDLRPAPVVITGPLQTTLIYRQHATPGDGGLYVQLLRPDQARRLRQEGRPIRYVNGIEPWYERVVGRSLAELGARPLLEDEPSGVSE